MVKILVVVDGHHKNHMEMAQMMAMLATMSQGSIPIIIPGTFTHKKEEPPKTYKKNYYEKNCGGEKGKARRVKQLARMPEYERKRQCIE